MRQSASQMRPYSAGPMPEEEQKRRRSGFVSEPRESSKKPVQSAPAYNQIPFGAIHVDASGTILEHRQTDTRASLPFTRIVGLQFVAIAPWAADSRLLSALKLAIDRSDSSFHFDFKEDSEAVERRIHVNILASGRHTAWIFISDKTLPLIF
jgi:hypothetical protein